MDNEGKGRRRKMKKERSYLRKENGCRMKAADESSKTKKEKEDEGGS